MKYFSRLLALALTAALFLPQGAGAASFTDLSPAHWAYDDMTQAVEMGLLTGYGDGSIHPEDTLTWGQYLVMLDRAFCPETYAARVASGSSWDEAAYWAAMEEGLLLLGDFLPISAQSLGQPILRREAVVLLDRVLPEGTGAHSGWSWYQRPTAQESFSDWDELGADYQAPLSRLFDAGIVQGRTDGTFGGGNTIKRADGSVMLLRVIEAGEASHYGEEKTVTLRFTDQQGNSLAADQKVKTSVGQSLWYLRGLDELLPRHQNISDYETVTTRKDVYTLVFRPYTRAENAEADFEEAVKRGEASWDDYYDQPFWLWFQGENAKKHTLLFGDQNKRRFANQDEAAAAMTTITIPVWKLDSRGNKVASSANLVIHAAIAEDTKALFTEIFNDPEQFPIHNIGGYGWRGDSATGEHNCGTAIDINAGENYQIRDGKVLVGSHWTPGTDPYSIPAGGSVVRIFAEHGWSWGGDAWAYSSDDSEGYHDYMHFSYMGG